MYVHTIKMDICGWMVGQTSKEEAEKFEIQSMKRIIYATGCN